MRYLSLVLISLGLCFGQGRWVEQDNPLKGERASYYDVCFVDSLHGWAYGWNRELGSWVVGTKDGGKTWEKLSEVLMYGNKAKSSYLNASTGGGIKFLDTLHGWLGCGTGIYFTRDGGKTWECGLGMSLKYFTDIEFSDTLNGWCVGGEWQPGGATKGLIYHTEDGGESWVLQDSAPHPLRAVCFVNDKKGFVVGDSGVMMRTLDGGEHWELIDLGITRTLYDIQFADSLHGIVVSHGNALRTIDGGETWIEVQGGAGNDVAFPDSLHVWTTHGYYSEDGGVTWDTLKLPGYYYGISFPDTAHGWVVGEYGKIMCYVLETGIEEISNKAQGIKQRLEVGPNPAIKSVNIRYYVRSSNPISLKVYDASGKLVEILINGRQRAGYHRVNWTGREVGVYFCQLETEDGSITKKFIVLK